MDQRRDDVTLLGDSVQYGLKHMLPECFVSVKLETYEEASSSDIHQYPATHSAIASEDTPPTGFVTAPVTCKDQSAVNASSSSSKQLCTASSSPQQVIYQIQLASPMMQQTQSGSQSQSTQATPQSSQISHSSDAEVSHVSQAAGRPPPPSHSFPHSHSRSTDIAWLSHSYVDQGSQHFHPHQLPYLPNDASLLTAIPQSEEGTRIVKQNQENQSAASAVSCRTDPPTVSTVSTSETGDNNAFISYVLNPQRGVSTAGIFLFDPSRGLHPPSPHQIQASNSEDGGRNSRSVDEVIRDSSSDSRSISESPKPGENHLVSRGCQTVLTMSQIQDGPLLPDTKIIIADTSTSEVPEPEETKHRVFTDADGRTYSSQQALVNHDRYHRGERPYECETCHKAFATNSHLVTHRRTHTGERPFQCQLCQRCFADRSAFVKHERTHGPNGAIIKRYKCDECGSGFVDSCGLKKHIRIHTGERPYVCNVCEKTFSTSSTFVAHKRIHTGERPYKCESCDKMFITKSHLLTHRRTHTGEKPFTCTVCNRCFADGSSFRRHERLHTGENRYTCMQCGRGFPLESSLEKHKQTHVPTSTFSSYMYENRNDLNCLSTQSCDVQNSRSTRITASQARETSDRNCVDLSREITGDVQVTRNNLCAVASREIDCDNQSGHTAIMVTAREIA
ncbi:zinc finger protein 184 isoform X2 [Frankliniella occidentalis]|uniref:Zinc finger protein 184 isoform X2 n=1 Tax=Frankliniella occidentalis TaxID=133901 RepID=A0A6J1S1R8_FRAOC|nr:zinc finger protein 184 isoform X2 [Frankliniella occidentalis]